MCLPQCSLRPKETSPLRTTSQKKNQRTNSRVVVGRKVFGAPHPRCGSCKRRRHARTGRTPHVHAHEHPCNRGRKSIKVSGPTPLLTAARARRKGRPAVVPGGEEAPPPPLSKGNAPGKWRGRGRNRGQKKSPLRAPRIERIFESQRNYDANGSMKAAPHRGSGRVSGSAAAKV